MGQNVAFQPLFQKAFTQSHSNLWCTLVGLVFRTDLLLGHVDPILTLLWPKHDWKWVKMLVSDHYQKKYSHNTIQTCGIHLIGECSELIRFLATLATFWHSSREKNDWKWWFLTIISKSIPAISFKLISWVFRIDSLLGHVGQIYGPLVAKKLLKMGKKISFRPLSPKIFTQSNSNLCCTLVALGPRWPYFGLLVAIKT